MLEFANVRSGLWFIVFGLWFPKLNRFIELQLFYAELPFEFRHAPDNSKSSIFTKP
jgi:hypothetical protein